MMKDVQKNGLHVLLGKTLVGSENFFNDKNNMWHNRLGHVSEKCIYYRRKKNFLVKIRSKLDFYESYVLGL